MRIDRLTLRSFRNYRDLTVTFPAAGAYITGANGSGKTNLLEAMYFLANQTSFRTTHREELQGWGATHCVVDALVTSPETQRQSELAIALSPRGRRLVVNGKPIREAHTFATHFAAVAFHPGTLNVIKGGPAGRRLLVDRGVASLHPTYVALSVDAQRALKQRNALLRAGQSPEHATLAVWTERFIDAALQITQARQDYVTVINRTLDHLVDSLGPDVGTLTLTYRPAVLRQCTPETSQVLLQTAGHMAHLRERFYAEAQRLRRAEMALGQTLFGPQRDEVTICYRGRESRSYASQGEQRLSAFLLIAALALAIQHQHGHRPVVLLDDVISELDARNRQVIFDFLHAHDFQVFITDVEARLTYHRLAEFTLFHVRQRDGHAELSPGFSPASTLGDVS